MSCPFTALVARHFAGRIAPEEERRLREHLAGCAACREQYQRHLTLARLDPAALSPRERLAVGLGLAPAPRSLTRPLWATLGAAAAALLVFILWPRVGPGPESGFSARGGAPEEAARLFAYRIVPGGPPAPLDKTMRAGDELAFAYQNQAGFRRLLVFGIDAARRVVWYHPAWSDAQADPGAVPILASAGVHELPEAVRHDLAPGPLVLIGLFLNQDLSVREAERVLEDGGDFVRLFPGSYTVRIEVRVEP